MTKVEILAVTRPEDLFPPDKVGAQSIYRKMSKYWHPDLATGSADVFAHITKLYQDALQKMASGRWEGPAFIQLEGENKHFYSYQARTTFPFPYGHAIVADASLVYLFNESAEFGRTLQQVAKTKPFASEDMRHEFERYLPHVTTHGMLHDGRFLLELTKTPDLVRLRDVVTHYGPIEPVHMAWMISSMLNLACYLTHANIVHHDISPDTYFLSPAFHSGALLGGWWSTATRGETIRTVPRRTFGVMPFNAKMVKRASTRTDLELIRLTVRECMKMPAPEPMQTWITKIGTGNAFEQYKQWSDILVATFGKRKFTPFPLTATSVYSTTGKVV